MKNDTFLSAPTSRRQFLLRAAGAATVAFAPSLLAGCGGGGSGLSLPSGAPDVAKLAAAVRAQTPVPALAGAYLTSNGFRIGAVGVRRNDQPTPIAETDLFQIASCTKSMTATLAGLLVEQGRIRFDSTLAQVFPTLPINAALRDVTLLQLLQHRSGLAAFESGEELLSAAAFGTEGRAARLALTKSLLAQAPAFAVGSFNYSNAGYGVAGAMLEAVANDGWENLLRARVMAPLGASIKYGWPGAGDPNQPWGHILFEGKLTALDPNDPSIPFYNTPIPALEPSGAVPSMNAASMARYVQLHLRGLRGQNGLLRAATIQTLHTPAPSSDGIPYACGWIETSVGGQRISIHNGSYDPFYALMVVVPGQDKAAIALCNTGEESGVSAASALVEKLLELPGLSGILLPGGGTPSSAASARRR